MWLKKIKDLFFRINPIKSDGCFKLLTSFKLTVPESYDCKTQLALFSEKNSKNFFYYYRERITDSNFAKVSNELVPGKTYVVKIFGIKQEITYEDCIAFLKTQKAIFVGAQGISLVWELKKEKFPMSRWTASFDEKDALWKDRDGYCRVPSLGRQSVLEGYWQVTINDTGCSRPVFVYFWEGEWSFRLAYVDNSWTPNDCLLCFCDLK